VIQRELAGVPGELHVSSGLDVEQIREKMVALARDKADYLLLLEPDWVIDATRAPFTNLSADVYVVSLSSDEPEREVLIRAGVGPAAASSRERLVGVSIHRSAGGDRNLVQLKAKVQRDPDDAGAVFQLARGHHEVAEDADDDDRRRLALELYRRRTAMSGWGEETYCAWHLAGTLSEQLGDWPAAADAFLHAWESRPVRLEAVQALAAGLRVRGLYRSAHRFAALASELQPLPMPSDLLLVEPWVYEWGLLFEYSITAYWCAEYDASIAACRRLLDVDKLPDGHRAATRRNLNYATEAKVSQAATAPPVRRMIPPGTPTRGYRGHDRLTPQELRAPGLARRLAELCSISPQEVDRRLLGLGPPLEVQVARLAPWPLRVRPGTSDVALIDTVCNGTAHLPPLELEAPGLIVDLGAQVGITTLDLARRYPSARFVAVEMDAASLTLCADNLRPLADRATLVGAAVTASDGSVAYSTTGDPGHHVVVAGGEGRAMAITLDTLFTHAATGEIVDYLKVNIEGSEQPVLGSDGSWPASVRSITVIAHGSFGVEGALADLRRLGFATSDDDVSGGRACGVRGDPRPFGPGPRLRRARARR
jgi:FkbM family methyltransferase